MKHFILFFSFSLWLLLVSCASSKTSVKPVAPLSTKVVVASVNDIVLSSLDVKTKVYERWRFTQILNDQITFTYEKYNETNNRVLKKNVHNFSIKERKIVLGNTLFIVEKIENKKIWYRVETRP